MPLMPPGLMTRKLEWKEFPVKAMTAPIAGVVQVSAGTAMEVQGSQLATTVSGKKPQIFKLSAEPIITVVFKPSESFVASYVSSWAQTSQDALLDHEQQHYLIAALTGRDYFNELNAVFKKSYPTGAELKADVIAARDRYSVEALQALSDKYDDDTKHNPVANAAAQAKWDAAIQGAIANPARTFKDSLKLLNMFP